MPFTFIRAYTQPFLPIGQSNLLSKYITASDIELIELIDIATNNAKSSFNINEIKNDLIAHGFWAFFYQRLNKINSDIEQIYPTSCQKTKESLNTFINEMKLSLTSIQLSDTYYQHQLMTLLNDFDTLNIKPILLKGAYIGYRYYDKTWLRPKSDIDIFVSEKDALIINDYFSKKGISAYLDMEEAHTSHFQSSYPIAGATSIERLNLSVDVHKRLSHHPLFKEIFCYQDCLANSSPLTLNASSNNISEKVARGLSSLDACHHAIIHIWGHHIHEIRLIWLMDIKLIVESMDANEKQQWIWSAHEKNILSISIATLYLIEQQFNVTMFDSEINIPLKSIEQEYHNKQKSITQEPCYALIINGEKHALYLRFQSTKGFFNKLQWLRQHLFPSSNYMRQRYQCQTKYALVKAYFNRPFHFLSKKN